MFIALHVTSADSWIHLVFPHQTNILRTHMKTHSDQKNFSCDLCGTSFRTKGSLIRHNRRHTGIEGNLETVCVLN